MKRYLYILMITVLIASASGCANPYNHEGEGAGIGGVLGALAGGIIGYQSHDAAAGMLIGGALGAAGGAVVGSEIQKPAPYPYGYPQTVVAQPYQDPVVYDSVDSYTFHVPNHDGSYTIVVVRRAGNGFVGPQGEFYPEFPQMSQLRMMYGR